MLVAIFINYIFHCLEQSSWLKKTLRVNVLPYIFLFMVCVNPVSRMINTTISPKEFLWEVERYRIGYILKDALKGKSDLNGYTLLHKGYAAHFYFYVTVMSHKGIDIALKKEANNLQPNDKVFAQQEEMKDYIVRNYAYKVLKKEEDVVFYQIINPLDHE